MNSHETRRVTESDWPRTISIIGAAGLVGSTVAAQLALSGIGQNLYLQDQKQNVLEAHVIDLLDATTIVGNDTPKLHLGGPPTETADIVIVAASIAEVPDGDRRAFLNGNAEILKSLTPEIERQVGGQGIVLLLSNPVDVLSHWFCTSTGFDASRVFGYALNDSARFQSAVASELEVRRSEVHGVVYGEHGKGQVPIASSIRVNGQRAALDPEMQSRIFSNIDGWFERWSELRSGRSSGWATGAGTAHLIKQLITERPVVATAFTGAIPGLGETFMTLPVQREAGVIHVQDLQVSDGELGQLQTAASSIRQAAESIDVSRWSCRS